MHDDSTQPSASMVDYAHASAPAQPLLKQSTGSVPNKAPAVVPVIQKATSPKGGSSAKNPIASNATQSQFINSGRVAYGAEVKPANRDQKLGTLPPSQSVINAAPGADSSPLPNHISVNLASASEVYSMSGPKIESSDSYLRTAHSGVPAQNVHQ